MYANNSFIDFIINESLFTQCNGCLRYLIVIAVQCNG